MKSGVEPEHVGAPVTRPWRESPLSEAVQSCFARQRFAAIFRVPLHTM